MKKANARLQKALQKFKDSQSRRFEPRRSVANAVITSVERDSVTGHTTGIVRATIDGIPDQNVFVGSGQGFSIGSVVRVENRGGSFSPDWTLIGRVGSVAGAEGTLDIDRTLSTPTGVVLSTDAYTPVAGAGIFSSVTVTFNQNQDYESVASYDIQWFKDSEGASTAQLISVPHVVGQATNLGVVGGLLPSSISVSQSYSFRVRAKAYSGAVGGWTEYASIETAADPTAPSTPTGLSAIAIDDYTLRLYWTANSEPDFSYYVLDVSATNSTSGRLTGYPRTVGNQNEFILGVSPNIPRYFAIKAVDATGNESDYSSFAGPFKTENLPSDAGLFYFGPTIELVAGLSNSALTMDVNFNILEAGWFVHLVAPNGTNEIVQINTSSPGGSTVSNGDGYRYNIVRAQGGTTAQTFAKGTVGHALTTAGYIQSDVREGVSNTPTIRMYEWDDPYTNVWADKTLRVALGNLGGITDPSLGALSGYGLYSDNVYLTGQIAAQGGAILGSIQIDGGSISSGGISIGDNGIIIDSDDGDWISWRDGSTFTGSVGANVSGTSHFLSIGAFNDTGSEAVSTRIEITAKQAESYVNILEDDLDVDFKGLRIGLVGGVPEEMLDVRGNAYIAGNILAATTGQDIGAPSARWDTLYVETVNANSITGSLDGLEVGVDIQAYDADLTAIAALAKTDGNFIVGNGSTWVAESGSTARTSLGLGSIATQAASSVAITGGSITGITDLAIADGGTGASTAANARTNLGLGTANSPTFAGLTINGNIGVTGTVDGVDVSAHKSRHESGGADAINHDSLTGFVANEHIDHTAVSITAGNGLTGGGTIASSRTLNVGAGNGISVAADSVAVNQAYDFTWTGLHTFDNHTEMDSVDINGALTVSDDLTVFYGGYSPLFVNVDTINPSNSNVGIMPQNLPGGVPDPQFALDVGGPLRAQYLIGPHAIQLSDAALIAHYDGPYPFETNFSGFAAGHLGQVATETGGVIYRPGKFGKAVQLAKATTNLVTNPSFETNTSGWATTSTNTIARSTSHAIYGNHSCEMTIGASRTDNAVLFQSRTLANAPHALTCWVYIPSSSNVTSVEMNLEQYVGATVTNASTSTKEQWVRLTALITPSSGDLSGIIVFRVNGTAGSVAYVDGIQLEQQAYATPYCDGSLGTGHTWTVPASPHASTSRRTTGTLVYNNVYDAAEGTLMLWSDTSGSPNYRASISNNNTGGIWFILDPSNNEEVWIGSSLKFNLHVPIPSGWNHWALTWSRSLNQAKLFLNGAQIGTTQTYSTPTLATTFSVSGFELLDDLVILSRAADAAEIRSIYESNAPVFAESSIEVWRTPTAVPIWVDSEGMWMRAVGGGETLGAYGGDATKSWGGKTLYQSDFLLGNATDGYIHWHAYQDDTDPWGEAGMEVKAQVDITGDSTISGALSAAGGNVVLDGDGIHLQGDSDGGVIAFEDGSTVVARIKGVTEFSTQRNLYIDLLPTDDGTGAILYIRGHNAAGTPVAQVAITEQGVINPTGGLSTSAQVSTGNLLPGGYLKMQGSGSGNYFTLNRLTTAQRDALSGHLSGTVIYNTSTNKAQVWTGSAWADLH